MADGKVRVWLWSLVSVSNINEKYWGEDIYSFLDKIDLLECDKVFFHNLRFDGYFLLYAFNKLGLRYNQDYTVSIDKLGHWFEIAVRLKHNTVVFWDSLKKFPDQGVDNIAKLYGIEGKKEKPFWERYIPEDYKATQSEIDYCIQDSAIIAYALGQEFKKGHKGITLSCDAFNEVKDTIGGFNKWRNWFPLLNKNVDSFVRLSYKGGWVYVNPLYKNKELENVTVYDNNSEYPWAMRNTYLPFGQPFFREPKGNDLYVVQFETMFRINEGYLPTIQIKNNPYYKETEYLTKVDEEVTLTLTSIDFELFKEHYEIDYIDEPRYISFQSGKGLLRQYIDKHMADKEQATIDKDYAKRFLAKRYMNSPYGKTGMRGDRISRIPYMSEDGIIKFEDCETNSDSIYVPYASFVCAQARNLVIRSAQKVYDNFVYADTDSIHLIDPDYKAGEREDLDLEIHPTRLGAWKDEGHFDKAKYLRAKTYIHATKDYEIQEIKCAGMPFKIKEQIKWDDFRPGKEFGGKICQTHVPGGCLLTETTFKIKE